jgi:malic enzyme
MLTDTMIRFVQLVRKHHPHSLLHFEDFGVTNAQRLLAKYRDQHVVFNDDMYVHAMIVLRTMLTLTSAKALVLSPCPPSCPPSASQRPNSPISV